MTPQQITHKRCARREHCINPHPDRPYMPISEFHRSKKSSDGYDYSCRYCRHADRHYNNPAEFSRTFSNKHILPQVCDRQTTPESIQHLRNKILTLPRNIPQKAGETGLFLFADEISAIMNEQCQLTPYWITWCDKWSCVDIYCTVENGLYAGRKIIVPSKDYTEMVMKFTTDNQCTEQQAIINLFPRYCNKITLD